MSTQVTVSVLPQCNFCGNSAHYDGATVMGPWAYMCDDHFARYGVGLGTGRGQELILGADEPERNRRAEAAAALEAGDWEAFEDAVGDGDPIDFL